MRPIINGALTYVGPYERLSEPQRRQTLEAFIGVMLRSCEHGFMSYSITDDDDRYVMLKYQAFDCPGFNRDELTSFATALEIGGIAHPFSEDASQALIDNSGISDYCVRCGSPDCDGRSERSDAGEY